MYIKRNAEARSRIHCSHGKSISITHCECVCVALVIQYAKDTCRILLSSVASLNFFQLYLVNGMIFGKKVMKPKMCFDLLYNFYLKHLKKKFSHILP